MDIFPYFIILSQLIAVIVSSVPVGFPSSDNSQAISYWIGLLSHIYLLAVDVVIGFHDHGHMIAALSDPVRPSLWCRSQSFQHGSSVHTDFLDVKVCIFDTGVLIFSFPVGNGGKQQ